MTGLRPYSGYKNSGADWLGDVPDSWRVLPAKAVFRERRSRSLPQDEHLTPSQTHGVLPQAEYMARTGNRVVLNLTGADSMRHVEPDDFISHLRSFQGGFEHSRLAGKVSAAYTVLEPLGAVIPEFFRYVFKSSLYIQALQTTTDQLRDGQSIRFAQVTLLPLPVPDLETQTRIAGFLDRETAEIDAFIADQEELIGLLAERRDATWQSAIDALEAPEVPLRRVVASIVDGPFGSSLTSAHYSDDGARVIRLGNIGINEFKGSDEAFISMDYFAELQSHIAKPGDVVMAGLGDDRMPLGRAAVVPDIGPAIVKADCYRVRPNSLATGEYLSWALSAPQTRARFGEISRGSTRQRLNTSVVRDVAIPLPAIHEQGRVVAESTERLRAFEAAISDAREAIALSKERRSALISAAVTGKIDVRGVA